MADMGDWGDLADHVDEANLQHPDEEKPQEVEDDKPSAADEYFEAMVPATGPYKVFITNMPFKTNEEEVAAFFTDNLKVNVVNTHLLTKDDGKLTGRGFVTLTDRGDMIKVLKMERIEYKGRKCHVEMAQKKGGGAGGSGGGNRGKRDGGSFQRRSRDEPRHAGGERGERRDRRHGGGDRRRGGDSSERGGNFSAFGNRRRQQGEDGDDVPPPPSNPRRAAAAPVDAEVADKWKMSDGGVMTVGEDGRPKLNLVARTAPLPEITVTEQPPLRASGGERRSAGGRSRKGESAKAAPDGWQASGAHQGGRRSRRKGGAFASAAAGGSDGAQAEEQPPKKAGGGTLFDALADSDSDSE